MELTNKKQADDRLERSFELPVYKRIYTLNSDYVQQLEKNNQKLLETVKKLFCRNKKLQDDLYKLKYHLKDITEKNQIWSKLRAYKSYSTITTKYKKMKFFIVTNLMSLQFRKVLM